MKTYLSDIIPKLKKYSKKLDDVSVLKNVHWKLVDEEDGSRVVYIFRDDNQLLISKDGAVEKGRWEYLGNDSLLIEVDSNAYLFKQGFYNDFVLGLKKDGINEYAIMVNEDKTDREIKTIQDLNYFPKLLDASINTQTSKKDSVHENEIEQFSKEVLFQAFIWIVVILVIVIIVIGISTT